MPFESSDAEIYFVVKYNGGAYYAPYSSWFVVERSLMGMFLRPEILRVSLRLFALRSLTHRVPLGLPDPG